MLKHYNSIHFSLFFNFFFVSKLSLKLCIFIRNFYLILIIFIIIREDLSLICTFLNKWLGIYIKYSIKTLGLLFFINSCNIRKNKKVWNLSNLLNSKTLWTGIKLKNLFTCNYYNFTIKQIYIPISFESSSFTEGFLSVMIGTKLILFINSTFTEKTIF